MNAAAMTPKAEESVSSDGDDEVRLNGEAPNNHEEVEEEDASISPPKQEEEDNDEEDETAVLTDQSATSLSTQGDGSTSRSSSATRQTVQDLESPDKNKQVGGCARPCRCCRCGETQPGAVAVDGASSQGELSTSSEATNRNSSPSSGHVVLDIQEDGDNTDCHRKQAVAEDIPMIQAELAEETPVAIRAELVVPPPVAYRVQFDEETPPDPTAPPTQDERPTPVVPHVAFGPLEDPADMKKLLSRRNVKWFIRCQVFLLVLGLVLGIVVPKLLQEDDSFEKDLEEDFQSLLEDDYHYPIPEAAPVVVTAPVGAPSLEPPTDEPWADVPSPTSAPTPRPSVTPVYDCFQSTFEIAMAQLENPREDGLYVLCPNIRYNVGTLNEDQTKIIDGGYPLTALLDSIEIRCGLDGRRGGHCVLDGGFLQVVLHPPSLPDEEMAAASTNQALNNVVFRGITFTGELNTTSDMSLVSGTSVYINHPGRNITFVDCLWDNMEAPNGLVQIGDHSISSSDLRQANSSSSFWDPEMDVTFENCTFSNVEYGSGGTPLISVSGQEATIRQCRFENVSLAEPVESCALGNGTGMEWCQGLVYCLDHSRCELTDLCVHDIEYAGPGAVATTSHESELIVSGSIHVGELVSPSNISFLNCSSGLARFADDDSVAPGCWGSGDTVASLMDTNSSFDFCMP